MAAEHNYDRLRQLLLERTSRPQVLVVGAGTVGSGLKTIISDDRLGFVETDVYLGPRTQVICDAHDIPFDDGTFDAVIIQGVICWLFDPQRAVGEIHRVLKDDGLVYSETPFIQAVSGGKYDAVRYTEIGHRRLFNKFEKLGSGIAGGPGTALACSYAGFLMSFTESRALRSVLSASADVTGFWLKYLDGYLSQKPAARDVASGFYFMGRKSDEVVTDAEVVNDYRGAVGS